MISHPAAVALPPPPPGYALFGWSGLALAVPEHWNLALHSPAKSMARQGLLVLSDLRGPAFEIRWNTPRRLRLLRASPSRALQAAAARLRRRHAVDSLPHAVLIRKRGMALVAGPRHLYELHCPRKPELLEALTRALADSLELLKNGPWLWCVYGINAWLPSRARLRQISMRAGDCRLAFVIPALKSAPESTSGGIAICDMPAGGKVTLAGVSLARQILRDRSLRAWAAAELSHVRDFPGGRWEESTDQATWRVRTRRLGRFIARETHLCHDPARNQIHWTHMVQPCKNGTHSPPAAG